MSKSENQLHARVETDALGTVAIPLDALWGIQTARSLDNLSFSGRALGGYRDLVRALLLVKRAAARANRDAGVLEAQLAEAIDAAAQRAVDLPAGQFPVDVLGGGGSIAVNMNINEVVAALAGQSVHPLRHVNLSQSTADVCHTAARLAVLDRADALREALAAGQATLAGLAAAHRETPTLARTCLQDALPTTAGVLFGGHAALLARRASACADAVAPLLTVALGGTVIGTGEGAPPLYREQVVAALAGLSGRPLQRHPHPADALQNSDDLVALSAALAALAQALLKIAQDLRLLASGPRGGFAELTLPAVQAGSSFFRGKINPVVPETVMQCAFQVFGCDRAVQAAGEHAELHLNVFDGLAAVNVLEAMAMSTRAVETLDRRCLQGLAVNEARCRELAETVRRMPPP